LIEGEIPVCEKPVDCPWYGGASAKRPLSSDDTTLRQTNELWSEIMVE